MVYFIGKRQMTGIMYSSTIYSRDIQLIEIPLNLNRPAVRNV